MFAAVVAILVDITFYLALADAQLAGAPFIVWSALKILVIASAIGWVAYTQRSPVLALIAATFAVVGLEDSIGITAPLGIWLIEETGIERGPQGVNSQLFRRLLIAAGLLGPTLLLANRAPRRIARSAWMLIGFLAAVFAAAVLGDIAADRTGTNLDELIEEPVLSLAAAFAVGLLVDNVVPRRLRAPTTGRLR